MKQAGDVAACSARVRLSSACRRGPPGFPRGFTLIELLIAVTIVAILAAIALPSYRKHVLHANRSAAESVMLEMASAEERFLTDNRAYTKDLAALGFDPAPDTVASNYTLDVTLVAGPPPGYSITATPKGSQADDTECGTLTLGSDGSRNASGPSTKCWK